MDNYSELQFNSRYNEIYNILVKNRSISKKLVHILWVVSQELERVPKRFVIIGASLSD